jgi:prevent-host-death family protein
MAMGIEISVSEFKAKCLKLIDKLERREIDSIELTKRGKPIAVVSAKERTPAKPTRAQVLAEFAAWQEKMKGSIRILDPTFDLTQPIFDPADSEAMSGRFLPDGE